VSVIRKIYRKILYRDIDRVYAKHFDLPQKPRNRKKVLDVGMGFGFDLITKHRQGYDCYGIDYDKSRVDKTRSMFERNGLNATLKVGSATKIPFGPNFFDEVICSHVIEHVKDDKKCVKELFRVLKKGGTLHLRVPHIHNLHTKFHLMFGSKNPYTDRTHVREYDKYSLIALLESAGFKVKSIKQSGFFPPVGLKFFMIISHYLPWGELMEYLGEKFPDHAAEIKIVAKK
jgi:ubiquinone/menaquinone biosynthesis C-methylase UbiE